MSAQWIEIGAKSDIPKMGSRIVRMGQLNIAVFRTSDDEVYALENKCAHKQGPLSEGIVHGCRVTCPLHNWVFDMKTGQATGVDEGKVKTYRVDVRDGMVFIEVEMIADKQPPKKQAVNG